MSEPYPKWRRYARFWGADVAADVDDELHTHLELRVEDNLARGMSPADARREALERFGDVERVRGECHSIGQEQERTMRRVQLTEAFVYDLRYAARMLARSPGFALVAVLSLALGIGASTAIFGLVDAVVLRPLPGVVQPHELVETEGRSISYPAVLAMHQETGSFVGVAGQRTRTMAVGANAATELAPVGIVTGNYFAVLGARATLGRTLITDDDARGVRIPVAVLSYAGWQRRFGGDSAVVGRTVHLNDQPFTVVGVMEPGFRGTRLIGRADLWIPVNAWPLTAAGEFSGLDIESTGWGWMQAIGRLQPGMSVAVAQAQLRALGARLAAGEGDDELGSSLAQIELLPARSAAVQLGDGPTAADFVLLLAATVGVALLIACANVASLLLARSARRRREISVRLALGAGRGRLMRQLFTESLLIALLGAAAALALAFVATRLLGNLALPAGVVPDSGLTWRMLGACVVLAALSTVIFGLAPALQASRPELVASLKDVGGAVRGARARLRSALVVAQLALSLLLLAGAALFVRSLQSALAVDPGYDTELLAAAGVNLSLQRYDSTRARVFYNALRERLLVSPGVERVSFTLGPPLIGGGDSYGFIVPARGADTARRVSIAAGVVDDAFFTTMGVPIVRGRAFTTADLEGAPQVLVVNETLARQFWPGEDALGQTLRFDGREQTIVGVARDAQYESLGEPARQYVYIPLNSANPRYADNMAVIVRATSDADAALRLLRGSIQALDANVPLIAASTYERALSEQFLMQRVGAMMLGLFGVLTLLLASVGIYGVMAYLVAQRTREIGVRVALGASRRRVIGLVLGRSAILIALGLGTGLALALFTARLLGDFLVGIGATDPLAFAASVLLLGTSALLASYLPARRATRIEPTVALRAE